MKKIILCLAASAAILAGGMTVVGWERSTQNAAHTITRSISRTQAEAMLWHAKIATVIDSSNGPGQPHLFVMIERGNHITDAFYSPADHDLIDLIRKSQANYVIHPKDLPSVEAMAAYSNSRSPVHWSEIKQALETVFLSLMIIGMIWYGYQRLVGTQEKTPAKVIDPKKIKDRFSDVAGHDRAKHLLRSAIPAPDLKKKMEESGALPQSGFLLTGEPGNGKTFLARALAGEAQRPFIAITGSDFNEKYIGVGAARVRQIIKLAQKKKAILFIDEIDAVGRARSEDGVSAGSAEHDATLNALLDGLDGIEKNRQFVVIAATNRPKLLDSALTRPGRFDREIKVLPPHMKDRVVLVEKQLAKGNFASDVTAEAIAGVTRGLSYADIKKLFNETKLAAIEKDVETIGFDMIMETRNNIMIGEVITGLEMTETEQKVIRVHEAGHLVVALCRSPERPVEYATVIPREKALGCVIQRDDEDRYTMTKSEMLNRITVLMAGRAGEKIMLGAENVTTGMAGDLEEATKIARSMVSRFNMNSEKEDAEQQADWISNMAPSQLSEATKQKIEKVITSILTDAFKDAEKILSDHQKTYEIFISELEKNKNLTHSQIMKIWEENK